MTSIAPPLAVTLALVAGSGCAGRAVTISAVPARPLKAATLEEDLNQRRGQTISMITHNPEAAAVANRTIQMRDGRVVEYAAGPRRVAGGQ